MNLGLTGPLNPLQPGNAALGAQPPRSPSAVRREAAGSGGLLLGRPGRRAGVAGAGSSSSARLSPRSPPPSLLASLPLPLRGPGARLCTFLPGPQFGRQELRGRDRAPERPRRFPAQGLLLTRGPAWACAAGTGDLGTALAARSWGSPSRSEVSGSWPARGAREEKGDLGSGSAAVGEKNSGLSFEEVCHFLLERPSSCGCGGPSPASATEGN